MNENETIDLKSEMPAKVERKGCPFSLLVSPPTEVSSPYSVQHRPQRTTCPAFFNINLRSDYHSTSFQFEISLPSLSYH